MVYKEKEKKKIKKKIESLLDISNNINAITKTRFLNELKKKTNKLYFGNTLNYMLSDLEGKNVEHLREELRNKAEETFRLIQQGEEEILKNTLKKVKSRSVIIVGEKTPLILNILKAVKNKKIGVITSGKRKINFEQVDLALIPIDKIDSKARIFTNKNYTPLLEKAKKHDIPVYGYTHSLKIVPKIKKDNNIKPGLVKSIISDLGVFDPEIFVQEVKLHYPWLFF